MRATEDPLAEDELESRFFDGMPEQLRSENSPPPSTLEPSIFSRDVTAKPSEGDQHVG